MLWIERRALPRLSFHVNWFFACQPNTFCRWLWSNRLSSPSWIHDVNNFFHSFYFVGDKFKKKNQYRVWMRLDAVAVSSWPVRCHLENGEIWTRDAITFYRSNYENNRIRWHTALRMHFISLAHWMMSERMDGMCHGIQLLQWALNSQMIVFNWSKMHVIFIWKPINWRDSRATHTTQTYSSSASATRLITDFNVCKKKIDTIWYVLVVCEVQIDSQETGSSSNNNNE